mgnify:CR=1 FL=1
MKNLLLIMGLGILPGCAIIDAYLMTKYDPNEYRLISEIRTDAMIAKKDCKDPQKSTYNAVSLANKTQLFEVYSENVPRNDNVIAASKDLNSIAQGLAARYNPFNAPSETFCKIKFESIENNASKMQQTIGARPR